MKHLYLIGGTMGVGKTTTCQILKHKLPNNVLLDGDWCWYMNPFLVTEETKRMVMNNIAFLLNSFLECSTIENILFCWVMHEQAIIDDLLSRLHLSGCWVYSFSLVCSEDALTTRMQRDVEAGLRTTDGIERSVARIGYYEKLNTVKIDVSNITPNQAAEIILHPISP